MMQDEFEKMIGKTVTPEDYSNIELVYTFYPGDMMKQVFADLYKAGVMVLIGDMLPRAKKIKSAENEIQRLKVELENFSKI